MARKPISKKLRFNVFKRDAFTCQYCGRTPPAVVLEPDHVNPVANGGDNDIDNLVTACFDCNRGKGAGLLEDLPATLEEKKDLLVEKEAQITEYKKLLARKKRRQNAEIKAISSIFDEIGQLTKADIQSIRTQFLPNLMPDDIEAAMTKAVFLHSRDPDRAWKYFCGICWNKIKAR